MEILPATSPCLPWPPGHFINHSELHEFYFFHSHIISWVVFIYLASSTCYLFLIAVCGRLFEVKKYTSADEKYQIAILIPCFREDLIIQDTAKQARDA